MTVPASASHQQPASTAQHTQTGWPSQHLLKIPMTSVSGGAKSFLMSEFHSLNNLDLAKETGQRKEPKLPNASTATAAGHSVGTGASSHCPMVLQVTKPGSTSCLQVAVQGSCAVCGADKHGETTDGVLQATHGCFLINTAKNYASFLISKELRRKNGSGGWEQHFSSLPSASILDDRTDLQSGIRHFPIPPLPRQLVVVPPRSSKAQAGSQSDCWTYPLSHGLFLLASQTTTSKHCRFPSGR